MERYSRQTLFLPLGKQGQELLHQGRVLIVGCGALGGGVADLLVRAGVGKSGEIMIIDPDTVQLSNLHRQTLFTEEDARNARLKVEAAKNALLKSNSEINLLCQSIRFDEQTFSMVADYDIIIDAVDNFQTRFLMNRAAIKFKKPFITAGVLGASGQIMTVIPGKTACLECFLTPAQTDSPMPFPVLGPLPQIFAALEAIEAIKILSGNQEIVNRSLFALDLWNNRCSQFNISRNEKCSICGD